MIQARYKDQRLSCCKTLCLESLYSDMEKLDHQLSANEIHSFCSSPLDLDFESELTL